MLTLLITTSHTQERTNKGLWALPEFHWGSYPIPDICIVAFNRSASHSVRCPSKTTPDPSISQSVKVWQDVGDLCVECPQVIVRQSVVGANL